MKRFALPLAATSALALACVPEGEVPTVAELETVPADVSEIEETGSLAALFDEAAAAYDVPSDVLEALAFTQTQVDPALGEVEFEGQPASFGLLGLSGADLDRAAALVGAPREIVETDDEVHLRAGAALLSALADEAGLTAEERADPLAWGPALSRLEALDPDLREDFAKDVLFPVRTGLAVPLEDGSTLVIDRHDPEAESLMAQREDALRAAGTRWLPSPNHNSRGGSRVEMVVIHTCEGSYAGCVGWLRQSRARASAHYVVKEDGSEVAQLVDETRRAWHISATYRRSRNGNRLSHREGQSSNTFSIGIEHGGRASQRSWPSRQIDRSVRLVRDITGRHNIPRDRYHIVGHGQLQPYNRYDPGPNWPWSSYLAAISNGGGGGGGGGSASVVTVDNRTSGRFRASGSWGRSTWASGKYGSDYRYRSPAARSDLAEFKVNIPASGVWEVFTRVPGNGYNTNAPYFIHHKFGRAIVRKDISRQGGKWVSLGRYHFDRGDRWAVQQSCWTNGRGYLIADAVRFVRR